MSPYLVPPQLPELPEAIRTIFDGMSRLPDIDSADLTATDQADALAARIMADLSLGSPAALQSVLVLNDSYGGIGLAAAHFGATVYSFQDRSSQSEAARRNAADLGQEATLIELDFASVQAAPDDLVSKLAGVQYVFLKLPRSSEELDWLAWVASRLCPEATLVAPGLQKYMTQTQNTVLERYFPTVRASRGFGKARALIASPHPAAVREHHEPWRQQTHHVSALPDGQLNLSGGAAVFGQARLDPGSRFMIEVLATTFDPQPGSKIIDLGCGNGTLAVAVALLHPHVAVLAADQSASAVEATRRSAELNGVAQRIITAQMDGVADFPADSADHVLLNPPFHSGHAVDAGIAHKLFGEAARVLPSGGKLWCVWNSPLKYRPILDRLVGQTEQLARNQKFTISVSTKS